MLVKGRICRRSPFYIKFPTLYPSLFAIVMHSLYFMTLLVPPQKHWKTFSIKANQHVCYHFIFFLLCISVSISSKQDCDFFQVAFAWCCPILLLPVKKLFAFQQSDSRAWLWMLLAEVFSVSQWNWKSKDPNCTFILKRKDIAEFIQKKKQDLSKISTSLHQFQLALISHLFSHFDFIWDFLVQVLILYSMKRI